MSKALKMFKATLLIAAVGFAFVMPQTADAQNNDKKDEKKVKNYDFSGDDIDGDLIKPDGDFIDTTSQVDHTSLIRIRKDFIKEILKSAEDL